MDIQVISEIGLERCYWTNTNDTTDGIFRRDFMGHKNYNWISDLIREDVKEVLRNADQAMQAINRTKKQAEVTEAKDNVAKKQRQLADINKPK